MTFLRRLGWVAVAAFIITIAVWAFRPWSDERALETPAGVEDQAVEFRCRAPLGGDTVRAAGETTATSYPLVDTSPPCHLRDERGLLALVNIGVGAAVLVLLLVRRRRAHPEPESAR